MLDDWTQDEGFEMIEIGSGIFVVMLIFCLGLLGK